MADKGKGAAFPSGQTWHALERDPDSAAPEAPKHPWVEEHEWQPGDDPGSDQTMFDLVEGFDAMALAAVQNRIPDNLLHSRGDIGSAAETLALLEQISDDDLAFLSTFVHRHRRNAGPLPAAAQAIINPIVGSYATRFTKLGQILRWANAQSHPESIELWWIIRTAQDLRRVIKGAKQFTV